MNAKGVTAPPPNAHVQVSSRKTVPTLVSSVVVVLKKLVWLYLVVLIYQDRARTAAVDHSIRTDATLLQNLSQMGISLEALDAMLAKGTTVTEAQMSSRTSTE